MGTSLSKDRAGMGRQQRMETQLTCLLPLQEKADFPHFHIFPLPFKHCHVVVSLLFCIGLVETFLKYFFPVCAFGETDAALFSTALIPR